jgi:hypothetical protein
MAEAAEKIEEEIEVEIEEEIKDEAVDEETVALAKSMGWVDEDGFRGDKSRWVGADKFVEKGMNDLPVLRERLRAQSKKLNDMEGDIQSFKTHHEQTQAREYQRAVKDLEDKQLATVDTGDTDEYKRIQQQKQDLAMDHSRTARPGSKTPDNPLYSTWKDENSKWFEKDAEMTSYANRASDFVAEMKPELIGKKEFLDEVDKEVRSRFKDRFENTQRNKPSAVETGGRSPRGRETGRSYSDLPVEAKAACDKFVRRGLITKDQYVTDYEWE